MSFEAGADVTTWQPSSGRWAPAGEDLVTCAVPGDTVHYCDRLLDRRIARATAQLQTDPAAALRAFTAIDHGVTDRAILAPASNPRNWWLSSERVGNYQNDIRDYGPLTSLLWVR